MSEDKLVALYDKLQKKSSLCLERNNRIFAIGGTKDMVIPLSKCYEEGGNNLFVVITN